MNIEEIRERWAKVKSHEQSYLDCTMSDAGLENAYAHSPTDIAFLLAEVERLKTKMATLKQIILETVIMSKVT